MDRRFDFLTHNPTWQLLAGFVAVLLLLTVAEMAAGRYSRGRQTERAFAQINRRIQNLWSIVVVFSIAMLTGGLGSLLVFAGCSFLLFREFVTITPTRKADHRTLFWGFFVILPLQYITLGADWYGLFVVLIPVYAFLFIPTRMAAVKDSAHFLERTARIQWSVMLCVYCVSYAPALLKLTLAGPPGMGARLLLFLCIIVQTNDAVCEFVENLRQASAPELPGSQTARSLAAGLLAGIGIGALIAPCIPLGVAQAAALAAVVCLAGSAGRLCLSAIRAERSHKDVVIVHRSQDMTGRFISLCFAAPLFFHIVRFSLGPDHLQLF